MPWTDERYPASMRRLSAVTRAKAIEIANALLAEGLDEGLAIRIAIAKAEEWARRRGTTRLRDACRALREEPAHGDTVVDA